MAWRMACQRLLHRLKQLFPGVVRKVAIPFFVLATVGWLLVVIGFGIGANSDSVFIQIRKNQSDSFPHWFVSIGGPIILVVGVVHAALSQRYSRIIGPFITLLNVLLITALGMIFFFTGKYIQSVNNNNNRIINIPNEDWVNLEFAGALITTFSLTAVMMLWPFYDWGN